MRKVMVAAVLLAGAAILWPGREAVAAKPCTVPKAWGQLRGVTNMSLGVSGENLYFALEDDAGTVRIVWADGCKVAAEIQRTP